MNLNIREITLDDAQILFLWANDPLTRLSSFNSDPILWDKHVIWLKNSIKNVNRTIYIVSFDGIPVGTVRFDRCEETIIGITVSPEYRGKGLGVKMIQSACEKYLRERNDEKITAYIKNENVASIKAFQKAGFVYKGEGQWNNISCKILILE